MENSKFNIIAFNVIENTDDKTILLNYSKAPLVLYFTGEDVTKYLKQDENFSEYLEKCGVFTTERYTNSKIQGNLISDMDKDADAYSVYKIDEQIQNMFPLDLNLGLSTEYIYEVVRETYWRVAKDNPGKFTTVLGTHNEICRLCPKTNEDTIINYYKAALKKNYNFTDYNLGVLYKTISMILNKQK